MSDYESQYVIHKPFDLRRLPLSRLLSLFPGPFLFFHSITLSVNALCAFPSLKLPRGYINQLELFKQVINFSNLRYTRLVVHRCVIISKE